MIMTTDIAERVKDLVRTKGAQSWLGLKTLQEGMLRDVPQPENLDDWLPAILVDIPRIIYPDPVAECAIRTVTGPIYPINIYYIRRYPENENTKREDAAGLRRLAEIFIQLTAQDRMTVIDDTLMRSFLVKEVDLRPAEFLALSDMLSDLSISAIRAEMELITLG